jgi:hypothetical protein
MVPVVVIGPPVKPVPVATLVTVPEVPPPTTVRVPSTETVIVVPSGFTPPRVVKVAGLKLIIPLGAIEVPVP